MYAWVYRVFGSKFQSQRWNSSGQRAQSALSIQLAERSCREAIHLRQLPWQQGESGKFPHKSTIFLCAKLSTKARTRSIYNIRKSLVGVAKYPGPSTVDLRATRCSLSLPWTLLGHSSSWLPLELVHVIELSRGLVTCPVRLAWLHGGLRIDTKIISMIPFLNLALDLPSVL